MNLFEFSSVKLLRLTSEDKPDCLIHDNNLIITALRDESTIVIEVPVDATRLFGNDKSLTKTLTNKITETQQQNKKRRMSTTNLRRGEEHFNSKLKEFQVKQIKECFASLMYMKQFSSPWQACIEIAKEYGVSSKAIHAIYKNHTWKHVNALTAKPSRELVEAHRSNA